MFAKIITAIQDFLISISHSRKYHFSDYCSLETACNRHTLVAKDGSLLTILEIDGINTIVSEQTYVQSIIGPIANSIGTNFREEGHTMQVCFDYRPDNSPVVMQRILAPSYEGCRKRNLDLGFVLDAQKQIFQESAADEKNYLLLWTHFNALKDHEAKEAQKTMQELSAQNPMPVSFVSANPVMASYSALLDKHEAYVSNILSSFNERSVQVKVLDVRQAASEIRKGLSPDFTSGDSWRVILPTDRVTPSLIKNRLYADEWSVQQPRISYQIANMDVEHVTNKIVKIDDTYYAPMYLEKPPGEPKYFVDLFGKMLSVGKVPYRVLFTIGGGGLKRKNMTKQIAQLLGMTNAQNRQMSNAYDWLNKMATDNTTTIVTFRVHMVTWADSEEKVRRNSALMQQQFSSWGGCQVSTITGNPIAGLAASSIGFTYKGIAAEAAGPLHDIMQLLPFSRPARIWESGSVLFGSTDVKMLPYQPMSDKQTSWFTLIAASSGAGKSMFMNQTNLSFFMDNQNDEDPYISIVDFGFSSKGLIDLLHASLPPERKHLVIYKRISNTEEYCRNVFDTMLCARFPTQNERENINSTIASIINSSNPNMVKLISMATDRLFEYYSDCFDTFRDAKPKTYKRGILNEVDNVVRDLNMTIMDETEAKRMRYENPNQGYRATTWWEITDFLFARGFEWENKDEKKSQNYYRLATIAQRYAQPVMSDLPMLISNDQQIKDQFGQATIDGESLIDVFVRDIGYAASNFKLLSGVTQFDLGDARVVSLDMEEVASGSDSIALMYALLLTTSKFFLKEENVAELPVRQGVTANRNSPSEMIKTYHAKRINAIKRSRKRLVIDEFHRTSKSPQVQDTIVRYVREVRKRKTEIILASQMMGDFTDAMLELMTSFLIMSPPEQNVISKIKEKIGVRDIGEEYALLNNIRLPKGREGGIIVGIFRLNGSGAGNRAAQLLRNRTGPVQLWAFTTTMENMVLLEKMTERLGGNRAKALQILAHHYPTGDARQDMAYLRQNMSADNPIDVNEHIINQLVSNREVRRI